METNDVIVPPGLEVTAANTKKDVIRVPVETEYSGTQRLLNVLADPPVCKRGVRGGRGVMEGETSVSGSSGLVVACSRYSPVMFLIKVAD